MEKFLDLIRDLFEETPREQISIQSNFKEFAEWDSLAALSLIALFDSEYNKRLSGDQIRLANTLEDLFKLTL